jgi:hypothetical protein
VIGTGEVIPGIAPAGDVGAAGCPGSVAPGVIGRVYVPGIME